MTHKLATWIDQFGTSGCVGCGRCIAWCPVAIDITEEAARSARRLVAEAKGTMQTIDELLEEIDVFRGLADEHLDLIAGCALNRVFAAGDAAADARTSRRTRSSRSATAPWRSRPTCPSAAR